MPRLGVVLLVAVVCLGAITGTAAADVHQIDVETSYDGGGEDADQRIDVTVTLSPAASDLTDVEVRFFDREAVIDDASYDETVHPDVEMQTVSPGHYQIDELEVGQEVTFSFVAYPRDITVEEAEVALIDLEFFDGGQSAQETVTADLTASPWFQLQEERQTVEEQAGEITDLETRVDRLDLVNQITDATFLIGLVVGLLGIGAAVVTSRGTGKKLRQQRDRHYEKLISLSRRANCARDEKTIKQTAEEIQEGEIDDEGGLLDRLFGGDDGDDGDGW